MLGQEYIVNDAGGVINMCPFLKRVGAKKYISDKNGDFLLLSDRDVLLGAVRIKNKSMRERAEAKICKFLGIGVRSEPQSGAGIVAATKDQHTRFVVAISCYENAITLFLPAALVGHRFACIYVDGKFLISRDPTGVIAKESTIERCTCTYSIREWFPGMTFPLFNQYKLEVTADNNSFEIPLLLSQKPGREIVPAPAQPKPPILETAKAEESPRDRAKRYIRWLNEFSASNDYVIKSEDNKLVLERNDRIA